MNSPYSRSVRWLALCILAVILEMLWARQMTGAPIEKDSAQLVRMALNLDRHGVISLEEVPPYTPTDYREPIPVFASALGIKIMDSMIGPAADDAYFSGPRAKYLKYQNLIWLPLLSAGAFWAGLTLTSSFALGLLALLLVNIPFVGGHFGADLVDGVFSDVPAAAFFMLASTALAVGFARSKVRLISLA